MDPGERAAAALPGPGHPGPAGRAGRGPEADALGRARPHQGRARGGVRRGLQRGAGGPARGGAPPAAVAWGLHRAYRPYVGLI